MTAPFYLSPIFVGGRKEEKIMLSSAPADLYDCDRSRGDLHAKNEEKTSILM